MDDLDIKDLLYYFKKNIFIIIEFVLVLIIIAEAYIAFFQHPMYKSYATILVNNKQAEEVTQNDISLNNQLIKTYGVIIKSRKVLSKAIQELGLNCTVNQLSSMISVSYVNDSQVIKVTVVNENNKKAKQIANTVSTIFSEEVPNYYKIDNVNILDEATVSKEPYNVNNLKTLILAIIIGAVLGSSIVFVKYYFDDTIKTIDDVEKSLGLPIMGIVPKQNIKSKESRVKHVRRISSKK